MQSIVSWITQGPNPIFSKSGTIPCLTGRNISSGRVNYNNPDYVDDSEYNNLKKYQIRRGDTLITLKGKGSIGKIGYVTSNRPAIFSRNIGVIRPSSIDSAYLNAFILSKFGQKMILRGETGGTGQTTLTTSHLRLLDVPVFHALEYPIHQIIDKSEQMLLDSQKIFSDTIDYFTDNIMSEIDDNMSANSEISISESFGKSGRLDAEYYQPKYEAIVQKLNTRETVLSLCKLHDKIFTPDEKKTYQYIELANVGQSGDISDVDTQYGVDLPTRARRIVQTGHVIVSSVEGSLQSCALITDEYDGALCSTGFYVFDSDCINSETLLVIFKSEPIQALMKQRCSGTILTAISKDELLSMPLPMIDENVQKEIANKVQESFALRKQAKQLLEYAKHAVEMAIEQGEDAALKWLDAFTHEQEA